MSVTIPAFWQLLADSRLLAPEQCRQLAADFAHVKGASDQASASTLAQWLVARNVLSKYQSTILLAGRAGPFQYGEYKVYDRVEKGRLAGQFRAVHAPTGHPVLLQFLSGPVVSDASQWAAAANNARSAGAIISPHVQRCYEPVDLQTFKFLVSEDLRGTTLDERIAGGRLPPVEACRIARQAAIGLAQMHQCGRVHGDVRPANILLEPVAGHQEHIKLLLDAHLAAGPVDFQDPHAAGRLAVQADYLAPELASPGRLPDPLTDIYALGCTLYAMLAGSPPFAGGTVQQKLARHATEPIRPLEQFGVPQPLAQLVAFMMAKNPAVRYQFAALVAEQLAPFVEPAALYVHAPAPPPTLANFESFARQKQAQLAAQPALIPAGVAVAPPTVGSVPAPAPTAVIIDRGRPAKANVAVVFQQRAKRKQSQQMAVAVGVLVACIALAVTTVIVMANLGGNENQQVAAVRPAPPVVPGPGTAPVTPTSSAGNPNSVTRPPGSTNANPGGTSPGSTAAPATPGTGTTNPPTPKGNSGSTGPGAGSSTAGDAGFQQEVLPDDGKLLWASPTTGKPVSFRCVPPEGQVFLIVRPADLIASGEGDKVLQALGPTFAAQRDAWEKAAGFKLSEIEQLIVTLHNNDAKFPRTSFVVKTKEAVAPDQLPARWGNPAAAQEGMATYYTGPAWAYYVSASPEAERTFLMAEASDVKEVAKVSGNPPALFREVERLRRSLDGDRHVTLLFYPQFLFNDDGEPLFAAERSKVRQPLSWLLGDGLQAAAVSMHFGSEFYFEMRMLGSLDKEPFKLSSEFRERLKQVPGSLEDYFVMLTPPPYWKKLSFRYPRMITQLHANMRVGVEGDQAVVNSVLPGPAAHNLVLGGELLIATAPGTAVAVAAKPEKPTPKSLDEALQLKTTYSFDQQSLEFAMRDLATDVQDQLKGSPVEFAIKIIGDDLKLDGITRNQSIRDFKQENQTVADILTALVRKANPVTTVKDPSETDQKLVWLIGPDPEKADRKIILITTRAAAGTKKLTLPAPFLPKKA